MVSNDSLIMSESKLKVQVNNLQLLPVVHRSSIRRRSFLPLYGLVGLVRCSFSFASIRLNLFLQFYTRPNFHVPNVIIQKKCFLLAIVLLFPWRAYIVSPAVTEPNTWSNNHLLDLIFPFKLVLIILNIWFYLDNLVYELVWNDRSRSVYYLFIVLISNRRYHRFTITPPVFFSFEFLFPFVIPINSIKIVTLQMRVSILKNHIAAVF